MASVRSRILISRRTLGELTYEAWKAVKKANSEPPDPSSTIQGPHLYRQGTQIVRMLPPESRAHLPRLEPINIDRLRFYVDRAALWIKAGKPKPAPKPAPIIIQPPSSDQLPLTEPPAAPQLQAPPADSDDESWDPVNPPLDVIRNMLADPSPPLPRLDAIITAPVFSPEGLLHSTKGYNRKTRTYLHPLLREAIPEIPAKPTLDQIETARDFLLNDLVVDFPFEQKRFDEGFILAMLLQPFVRPMIHSFTPFYLIDKPQPGTGASLLAQSIISVVTGGNSAAAASIDIRKDDTENAKKLLSVFSQTPTAVFLDNIDRSLESKRLTETLTSHSISDRILGKSEIASYPVRCLWIGTGNNPKMSADMVRRTIRIRLNARMAKPETRNEFKHGDQELWVSQNLPQLLHACLTICQFWVADGCPLAAVTKGGGFEHWSQVMGAILAPLSLDAPFLGNAHTMHDYLDDHDTDWINFTKSWWDAFGDRAITSSEIYNLWERTGSEIDLGNIYSERGGTTRMGQMLTERKDKHFGHLRLVLANNTGNKKHWRLEKWDWGDQYEEESDAKKENPSTEPGAGA
jgi:hypothetical protein